MDSRYSLRLGVLVPTLLTAPCLAWGSYAHYLTGIPAGLADKTNVPDYLGESYYCVGECGRNDFRHVAVGL